MKRRLYIVDAMALAFRSFYAMGRSSLTTAEGVPTGAIFGSAMFLNKLIAEDKPDYLLMVADAEGPTFRDEIYEDYKATRDAMPDDLGRQLPFLWELFAAFKLKMLRVPGVEADDVIASVARRFAGDELTVYIVSGDKDFLQLVDDDTLIYAPKKNEEALILDAAGVKEKIGVTPAQVVDWLALVGDTADNVPGVAGIGEKGAAKLLAEYGSLDGIYAGLAQMKPGKQRDNLEQCRADAYLSQKLVTLKCDVAFDYSLEDFARPADANANETLLGFYDKFEFKVLAGKVKKALAAAGTPTASVALETHQPGRETLRVDSAASAKALRTALAGHRELAFAVRGSGFDVVSDKAVEVAIATKDGTFVADLSNLDARDCVAGALAVQGVTKVGHGTKYAYQMLANAGVAFAGPVVDLKICDYLLDPNNYNHELDGITAKLKLSGVRAAADFTDIVNCVSQILMLYEPIKGRIDAAHLRRVLDEVETPLVPVLASMEREGVYVDAEFLDNYSAELDQHGKRLEAELYREAGETFNINSPKQLQELLFEKLALQNALGLKRLKKTKTGFSTDESVLSRLDHPVPRLILEYRTVSKLKNTYVDSLPQFINPVTQRIHTTLGQTVAATGRLSCDRPNLQNIPMRTELGRKIRRAFMPQAKGDVLISADYSQVELRLLAHLSKAEGLIEAFKLGLDIHTVTAAKIFNVKATDVDPVMRSRAKAVNFGIIYGMGPQRLAQETGVSLTAAKDFIARYFEVYPGIRDYTEHLISSAKKLGFTTTIMGRRRPIPELNEKSRVMAVRGENIAVNAPIQGSAADLIKLAMIRIHHDIINRPLKLKLILQIHDELLFSCPKSEVERNIPFIRDAMENALETSVPLRVDVKFGGNWLEAH